MNNICEKCNSVLEVTGKGLNLETRITPMLFTEGLINEFKRKIQTMRKKAGYEINDEIIVCTEAAKLLNFYPIKKEVLAISIMEDLYNGCDLVEELYGVKIGIKKHNYVKKQG